MNFFKSIFGKGTETPEEKAKDEAAQNFDVLKFDGVRAMRTGQMAYAIQCFSHALDMRDDLETRDYYSQVLIQSGALAEGYGQLELLAEAQPHNQPLLIHMAEVAYMMEDYAKMSHVCERAKAIDATNPQVYYFHAQACVGQGQPNEAIEMLTEAVAWCEKADAEHTAWREMVGDVRLLRGETLLATGAFDQADDDALWLLEHAPDSEDAVLLKARIEERRGNHAEAVRQYDQMIELNPFSLVAFSERAAIKEATGDQAGAAADLRMVAELTPAEAAMGGEDGMPSADGGIEQKVTEGYRSIDPFGIG